MPRLCSSFRLSLVALFLAMLGSVAWAKPKVAILGLETINVGGVDPKDAANATALTEALRAIPRGGQGRFDFAANSNRELQDEKLMGNCDTEKPVCMAPIGVGLGADYLIFGNIKKDTGKDGYKVTLKLLVVKPPKLAEEEDFFLPFGTLAGGAEPLREWAQKAYAKLTGEKQQAPPTRVDPAGPGKLIVNSNAKSGDVFIGSSKKGRLVDGTLLLALPEGQHDLAIEATGYRRYEATVMVKSGQQKVVDAQLEEMVGPPPLGGRKGSPALKYSGYGLVGVGGAALSYALFLTVAGPIPKYTGNQNNGKLPCTPESAAGGMCVQVSPEEADSSNCGNEALKGANHENNRAFKEACSANTTRTIAVAVGIAGVALGAGALFFAYRSEGDTKEKQTAEGRRTRRQLTVTPVISPSGGGATVRFDW